jgi:hypothetical protein
MNTYHDGEIDRMLHRRVCARCYENLQKREAPGRTWEAYCPTCGEAWGGRHISRWTAEHRGQRALAEAWEVKANLRDLFPNPHQGREAEELIRELGK